MNDLEIVTLHQAIATRKLFCQLRYDANHARWHAEVFDDDGVTGSAKSDDYAYALRTALERYDERKQVAE